MALVLYEFHAYPAVEKVSFWLSLPFDRNGAASPGGAEERLLTGLLVDVAGPGWGGGRFPFHISTCCSILAAAIKK